MPVESEAGSGARSRTCSGILRAAAAVVNAFVRRCRAGAGGRLDQQALPMRPAMIAAYACPPLTAAWAAAAVARRPAGPSPALAADHLGQRRAARDRDRGLVRHRVVQHTDEHAGEQQLEQVPPRPAREPGRPAAASGGDVARVGGLAPGTSRPLRPAPNETLALSGVQDLFF